MNINKILIYEIIYYIVLLVMERLFMDLEKLMDVVFIKILCYIVYMNLFIIKNLRVIKLIKFLIRFDNLDSNFVLNRWNFDYKISIKINLFFILIYYGCYTALIIEDVIDEFIRNLMYKIILFLFFYIFYKINKNIVSKWFIVDKKIN